MKPLAYALFVVAFIEINYAAYLFSVESWRFVFLAMISAVVAPMVLFAKDVWK